MTGLEYIGLAIAALAGGLTALVKKYRFGPFLDKVEDVEIPDFTDLPYLPPIDTSLPEEPPSGANNGQKHPTVEDFCYCIKDYEGWILPGGKDWSGKVYPRGSRSYQNNSPGNVKFSKEGYLPKYGNVKKDKDGFAIFPTRELGELYLNNMVRGMIHKRPNQTILQFMERYAPSSDDNNPTTYSAFIGKRLAVDYRTFKMGDLL